MLVFLLVLLGCLLLDHRGSDGLGIDARAVLRAGGCWLLIFGTYAAEQNQCRSDSDHELHSRLLRVGDKQVEGDWLGLVFAKSHVDEAKDIMAPLLLQNFKQLGTDS